MILSLSLFIILPQPLIFPVPVNGQSHKRT